jgi:diguanylate cyclase (GGDEF)-like protein
MVKGILARPRASRVYIGCGSLLNRCDPRTDKPIGGRSAPMSKLNHPLLGRLTWPAIFAVGLGTAAWAILPTSHSERFVLSCSLVLLVCGTIVRWEWHWRRPMARLLKLLPQIRGGEGAIEEISTLQAGGFAPLLPALREMLHELRRQKMELQTLNEEMRQRVASRTNALERAIGALRRQATHDPMTGLYNRLMFEQTFARLVEACRHENHDLAVLMLDVDHFKSLNDTLGHAAGDQLLRDIGQLIRSSVRDGADAAFRMGGDEFVILMTGADEASASALAQRLISLVDAHAKTLHTSPRPRLSIGAAQLSHMPADASPEALLGAADRQLYKVKSARKSEGKPAAAALSR